MNERLRISPPKPIPEDEITKSEHKHGEKFPDYRVDIRAREKTPEQADVFNHLEAMCTDLSEKLFKAYPDPWTYDDGKLDDIWTDLDQSLLHIASMARELAGSYRGFNVGGAVIGLKNVRYPENPWVILFDANTKPNTVMGAVRKHCAELRLMERMDPQHPETSLPREKIDRALAFAIVAEPQQDDDSQKTQITLTPCKLCRTCMWKMSQRTREEGGPIVSERTGVLTADYRNTRIRKLMQVRDLHRFHNEVPPGYQEVD